MTTTIRSIFVAKGWTTETLYAGYKIQPKMTDPLPVSLIFGTHIEPRVSGLPFAAKKALTIALKDIFPIGAKVTLHGKTHEVRRISVGGHVTLGDMQSVAAVDLIQGLDAEGATIEAP